jgi:UDP-N-acetylglucosamine enolpyruvyl transferase
VTGYKPELEDWIFHCVLPLIAYATLLVSGAMLTVRHVPALFGVALFSLILLFVGIHNAWDTVTYITITIRSLSKQSAKVPASSDTATQAKPD